MPYLVIKDVELIRILMKHYGFKVLRQRGSHLFLTNFVYVTTVPYHNKELGQGLLNKILKDCRLSKEEIKKYL
ncbi:MAG: type II toxin-antitoxin system HicA family toxin [Candidatus Micrarchaeota archaeon]|nr:type II toxin-antitoxin system HicA family toxin [Candidatus Micrarchaeota archaeon]MDE1846734.1 type II toxin-antitoxin system HicA family toxin [Candidatus Micrarchaeota archaeon]